MHWWNRTAGVLWVGVMMAAAQAGPCRGGHAADQGLHGLHCGPDCGHAHASYATLGRWSASATASPVDSGWSGNVLTWGFATDGTPIEAQFGSRGETDGPSDLVAALDGLHGAGPGGPDLSLRPWFELFERPLARWAELSGLTFLYEPADDGATIAPFAAGGALGVRGDLRFSGHAIDGTVSPTILAYNYFPFAGGDMIIDTEQANFLGPTANDSLAIRNIIAHEIGHGLGLLHPTLPDDMALMEATFTAAIDGPQFDDVLGIQSLYGDRFDKLGRNDSLATATDLGTLTPGVSVRLGTDASDTTTAVAVDQFDYVSAGGSDVDYYAFELSSDGAIDLSATPRGPAYELGPEGFSSLFDATSQADLLVVLFDGATGDQLAVIDDTGLGEAEALSGWSLEAGRYAVLLLGLGATQTYELEVLLVPEPGVVVWGSVGVGWFTLSRKRRG